MTGGELRMDSEPLVHVVDRFGFVWRVVRDGGMVTRADYVGIITMGINAADAEVGPLRPLPDLRADHGEPT